MCRRHSQSYDASLWGGRTAGPELVAGASIAPAAEPASAADVAAASAPGAGPGSGALVLGSVGGGHVRTSAGAGATYRRALGRVVDPDRMAAATASICCCVRARLGVDAMPRSRIHTCSTPPVTDSARLCGGCMGCGPVGVTADAGAWVSGAWVCPPCSSCLHGGGTRDSRAVVPGIFSVRVHRSCVLQQAPSACPSNRRYDRSSWRAQGAPSAAPSSVGTTQIASVEFWQPSRTVS